MKAIEEWRGPREKWSTSVRVIAFVVALSVCFALVFVVDAVWSRAGSAPVPSGVSQVQAKTDCGAICDHPHRWAKRHARKFRQGKIDPSPVVVTRHIKKKINRWFNNHPKIKAREMAEDGYLGPARGGWCSWCDFFPEAVTCMASLGTNMSGFDCEQANDDIATAEKSAVRVAVKCAGSMLIAFKVAKSPALAVGAGGLTCLWGEVSSSVSKCYQRTARCREQATEVRSGLPQLSKTGPVALRLVSLEAPR